MAEPSQSIEIDAADVIRLIEQFLSENNLTKSLNSLQEETGIKLNTVPDIDSLVHNIHQGYWDLVLQTLKHASLSNRTLMNLYEQIVLELVELRELAAARHVLRQTEPMDLMRQLLPERYLKLETLLSKTCLDSKEIYADGGSREKRRQNIATEISGEAYAVDTSRMLTLLGQALKWQKMQGHLPPGSKVDLFRGRAIMPEAVGETFPLELGVTIKFASNTFPQSLAFSSDGQYLVSGSSDGFIEVWNYSTGKLRMDLKYQAQESFMLMEDPVTALTFSVDSELLGSGSSSGGVKVWRISTGQCVNRLDSAHSKSISCLVFSRDGSQLFSSGVNGLIRLHSLRSGALLKEFSGHTSYINSLCYASDRHHLVSGSSDGSVRFWTVKGTACVGEFMPSLQASGNPFQINYVFPIQAHPNEYVVCSRSDTVVVIDNKGRLLKSYPIELCDAVDEFILAVLSPKGNWFYPVTQSGVMHCLNLNTGKYEHTIKLHDAQVTSHVHHPQQNIIASCSSDGLIKIWK